MLTFGAVFFEGAGIAGSCIGSIHLRPFCIAVLFETQEGTLWARIGVLLGIILELPLSIEWRAVVKVRQGLCWLLGTSVRKTRRFLRTDVPSSQHRLIQDYLGHKNIQHTVLHRHQSG